MGSFQKKCLLYVLIALWAVRGAAEVTPEDINRLNEQAERMKNTIPQVQPDPQMVERAKRLADQFFSDEYQKRIEQEYQRLFNTEPFKPQVEKFEKYTGKAVNTKLQNNERLYLFVSFSMPEELLRTYVSSAERYGVKIVLKGSYGGLDNLTETIKKIQSLLLKNPSCQKDCEAYETEIMIDPFLFRRYRINKVPAFVYVKGVEFNDPEMSEGYSNNMKSEGVYYVLYGDVSLEGGLRKLYEASKAESLSQILSGGKK